VTALFLLPLLFLGSAFGNLANYADPLGRVTESGYSLTCQITSLNEAPDLFRAIELSLL